MWEKEAKAQQQYASDERRVKTCKIFPGTFEDIKYVRMYVMHKNENIIYDQCERFKWCRSIVQKIPTVKISTGLNVKYVCMLVSMCLQIKNVTAFRCETVFHFTLIKR